MLLVKDLEFLPQKYFIAEDFNSSICYVQIAKTQTFSLQVLSSAVSLEFIHL